MAESKHIANHASSYNRAVLVHFSFGECAHVCSVHAFGYTCVGLYTHMCVRKPVVGDPHLPGTFFTLCVEAEGVD